MAVLGRQNLPTISSKKLSHDHTYRFPRTALHGGISSWSFLFSVCLSFSFSVLSFSPPFPSCLWFTSLCHLVESDSMQIAPLSGEARLRANNQNAASQRKELLWERGNRSKKKEKGGQKGAKTGERFVRVCLRVRYWRQAASECRV